MDGENVTQWAFRPTGAPASSNVTIRGFEIKNYLAYESNGWNEGAITSSWYQTQGGGSGWLVEDVNVHHNRGAGIMLTNQGTLRNSQVHHNYSIGVKSTGRPTVDSLKTTRFTATTFDGPPTSTKPAAPNSHGLTLWWCRATMCMTTTDPAGSNQQYQDGLLPPT